MKWASLDMCSCTEPSLMAMSTCMVAGLLLISTCVATLGLPRWWQVHRGLFVWFSWPILTAHWKQASPVMAHVCMGLIWLFLQAHAGYLREESFLMTVGSQGWFWLFFPAHPGCSQEVILPTYDFYWKCYHCSTKAAPDNAPGASRHGWVLIKLYL